MSTRAFGTLYAWGANHLGQCGRGPGHDQLTPSPVPGLPPVQAVATNSAATLALDERGRVWSWGSDDCALLARPGASGGRPYWLPSALRALGHRNTLLAPIPIQLPGRPLAFAAQGHHSYTLMND